MCTGLKIMLDNDRIELGERELGGSIAAQRMAFIPASGFPADLAGFPFQSLPGRSGNQSGQGNWSPVQFRFPQAIRSSAFFWLWIEVSVLGLFHPDLKCPGISAG